MYKIKHNFLVKITKNNSKYQTDVLYCGFFVEPLQEFSLEPLRNYHNQSQELLPFKISCVKIYCVKRWKCLYFLQFRVMKTELKPCVETVIAHFHFGGVTMGRKTAKSQIKVTIFNKQKSILESFSPK